MAFFYRRKYDKDEIKTVWKVVNKLFPDYTKEEKKLAMRSILTYHWVVYHPTITHNILNNVRVVRTFEKYIKKMAKKHQIPEDMFISILTWENSGGLIRRSWASCVGIGQLSLGAVATAHQYYKPYVKKMGRLKYIYTRLNSTFHFPLFKILQLHAQREIYDFSIAKRHREIQQKLYIKDERHIPQCNIEDSAIYLKLLYNNYANRIDLTISAYHNGGINNNDILRDYIWRHFHESPKKQKDIIKAIKKYNIKYISLWKDLRSRDMLNGLRTVFGDVTTYQNSHLSLKDESDIYPWKVAAAYGAYISGDVQIRKLMKKYRGDWDVAECRGMKIYTSIEDIRKDIKKGLLVKLPPFYIDRGISAKKNPSKLYKKKLYVYNYYVLPETAGFLIRLTKVLRKRSKDPNAKIPIRKALESKILPDKGIAQKIPEDLQTHLQGASLDIDIEKAPHRDILRRILKEGYLHDKIIIVQRKGIYRVCVNPRYGMYFYKFYKKSLNYHKPIK